MSQAFHIPPDARVVAHATRAEGYNGATIRIALAIRPNGEMLECCAYGWYGAGFTSSAGRELRDITMRPNYFDVHAK